MQRNRSALNRRQFFTRSAMAAGAGALGGGFFDALVARSASAGDRRGHGDSAGYGPLHAAGDIHANGRDRAQRLGDVPRREAAGQHHRQLAGHRAGDRLVGALPRPAWMGPAGGIEEERFGAGG